MRVIGIHSGHHSAATLLENFKVKTFIEGDRFDGHKYGPSPYEGFSELLTNTPGQIDFVTCLSIDGTHHNFLDDFFNTHYKKVFDKRKKLYNFRDQENIIKHENNIIDNRDGITHHFFHAMNAFFQSGKSEAIIVVSDGMGLITRSVKLDDGNEVLLVEYTSFYYFEKNKEDLFITPLTKKTSPVTCKGEDDLLINDKFISNVFNDANNQWIEDFPYLVSARRGPGFLFEAVCEHLSLDINDAGKLMGLSSYGDPESNFSSFVKQQENPKLDFSYYIDHNIVKDRKDIESSGYIDFKSYPEFAIDNQQWYKGKEYYDQKVADIAAKAQQGAEHLSWEDIKHSLKLCDQYNTKNIIATGGYYLNVVNNYKIRKKLNQIGKKDYDFYVDPLSNDSGTAIGMALWTAYHKDQDKKHLLADNFKVFDNLYLGIPRYYSKHDILSYGDFEVYDTTAKEVAQLIADRNIVAIFQSRSEAGPRALGNRSIVYDPTDPNGRDIVNKVKKREWYRPFAGSVLWEYVSEYFDMQGLEESPYMMFALDVWENKKEVIPSILHVDGTSRIQTVKNEQNPHYYELIENFRKITGIPILFNTSFNLAGDPLVETLEDAIYTMRNSDINYMYMPETNFLIKKG